MPTENRTTLTPDTPVRYLKGVGPKTAERFEKLGIVTLADLLCHYPRRYIDFSKPYSIAEAPADTECVVKAEVFAKPGGRILPGGRRMERITAGDDVASLEITWFNNPYATQKLQLGQEYYFQGIVTGGMLRRQMVNPQVRTAEQIQAAPFEAVYPQTEGLSSSVISRCIRQLLSHAELLPDPLPPEMLQKYRLLPKAEAVRAIHCPATEEQAAAARRRLIYEELLVLQLGIGRMRSRGAAATGAPMRRADPAPFWQSLPFAPTGAQRRAVEEILNDMSGDTAMNRLLQGDVGSGKTLVAAAAIWACIRAGYQAALLAPTEILAAQHAEGLNRLLAPFGMRVALLTGGIKAAARRTTLAAIRKDEADLVVGTHALMSEGVEFARLGLAVIDEQHRFGVRQRGALAEKAANPHLLVMSATPIPRTLGLLIYGDLDISILDELPPGRTPVKTRCITGKRRQDLYRFLDSEIDKGRQVYLVCPAIEDVPDGGLNAVKTYYEDIAKTLLPDRRVGLISQIPVYPDGYTVEDVLRSAFERMFRMKEEMDRLTEQMAAGDSSSQTLKRYGELTARFEGLGGYDTDTAVNKVANGLSIDTEMRQRLFDQLSGGEKTRVNLGRLILEDTDILLLDEPTNHLDLQATEWLEEYIRTFRGTVVTISHDRYFLDRTVTRIIEVLDGKAEFYSGNYSFYAVEKERRYQERLKQYLKEQAKIQQLEKAAEQMHLWAFMGNDALHKRAFSMEKRIQRMRTTEKPTKAKKMDARFASRQFKGDEVLQVKGVSKAFDGRTLFSDIYLRVEDGERIALIGENGTGKTTLLNMLLGIEPTDSGIFKLGPSVKAAYLPQIIHFDHPERSILDTMLYEKKGMTAQSARNRLAAYQFQGEDVFKPVSVLSGGELSRLRLCMLMDEEINLLILDEPTNHLDIAAREWIEEAVEAFDGTLLFVSHDRYFIQRFATRIWELADGTITDYPMGFAQYRAVKAQEKAPQPVKAPEKKGDTRPPRGNRSQQAARRQLTICETGISKLEAECRRLDEEMAAHACDAGELNRLYQEKQEVEARLEQEMARWEELSLQIEE